MNERSGIFAGDDPFALARTWVAAAQDGELNDPNAIALSTVDSDGLPNVRLVLLKDIDDDAFIFYTNYGSKKSQEIEHAGKAAFVWHSKFLRRQIRVRGTVVKEDGPKADEYYASRSLKSRIGAWASNQPSTPTILGWLAHFARRNRILGRWRFSSARPIPLDA